MIDLYYQDANINDLEKIVQIYNSTIASRMVTADTEPVSVASKSDWFYNHNPQKRPLWVVQDNTQKVVGWVSFQSFYGRPAYDATVEISIYLDADQRGKGIGKQILAYSIANAPKFGIKTLLGFVFLHNQPSLQLFRHFGFQDWAVLPDIALLDGLEKSLVILGKRIA